MEPQKGSPRVTAWVHTILNPWVDALRNELSILERGEVTWNFSTRKLRHILPMKCYVADAYCYTLDDYLRARPEVKKKIEDHDDGRDSLEKVASAAYDELLKRPQFCKLVDNDKCLREHINAKREPPGDHTDEFMSLIVERLINQTWNLPNYHKGRDFWAAYVGKFHKLRVGPAFTSLDKQRCKLEHFDRAFLNILKDWRFELIDKYDILPQPYPGSG